jgi:hypothetical protein
MFASAQFRISVTFPGKITKSTGEISKDRRTVTWNPAFGEKTDLATTVELDTPMNFVLWTIGGVIFIALVILLIILNRRKKLAEVSSDEMATPPIESQGVDEAGQDLGLA